MSLTAAFSFAKALHMGVNLAMAAYEGVQAAKDGMAIVERLVAEGRDPTPEEFNQLTSASLQADAQLRAIRDRLTAERDFSEHG